MNESRIDLVLLLMFFFTMTQAQTAAVGHWEGKLQVGVNALRLVIHITEDSGMLKGAMDSPDQGAKDIPCTVKRLGTDSLLVDISMLGANYECVVQTNRLIGTFSQHGLKIPLTLTPVRILRRPQLPQPPFSYISEEVTFRNEKVGIELAGTLCLPKNANVQTPVVVLVSGSGLQNRDEELMDHKPFLVIADYLARHGIASLRYDDRGFGASEGKELAAKSTTSDFADDAEAAVQFLRSQNRFSTIGVAGHSEGASVAFMLGAKGLTDFIVSMAGIGVKGDSALTAQANRILELQGKKLRLTVSQYREQLKPALTPWVSFFIDYDPTADFHRVKCPVMAINGTKDCQIISELNLSAIRAAFPSQMKTFIKEYPGLNHLFQHADSGLPEEYREIEETISPEVLQDMEEFILGVSIR